MDPTPSLLSFGEVITLVRQRLNASSERAAAVVREALKSGELHIIRDEHVDPISGSESALFNPLSEFASSWRHCGPRNKSGNPRHIRRDPPRFIFGEQLGCRPNIGQTPSHLSEVPLRRHC